jgi:acyl-coenzyme A thioesterase PaaI-like protein
MQSRFEKVPSFSRALGLNSGAFSANENVSFDKEHNLTFRLPLTKRIQLPRLEQPVALSTYLAIIDDVTTWALVLGDLQHSRPGVSVSLRAEWGPAASRHQLGDQVDVVTSVSKIGRNLGFVRAEVRDVTTGDIVCSASHIKYLSLGIVVDFMLSSYGWNTSKFLTDKLMPSSETEAPPLIDLFDSLKFESDNRATFEPSLVHASSGGPIHGGCQAVLMQMVATRLAQRELGSSSVRLDSIAIDYMASPKAKITKIDVQTLPKADGDSSVSLRVQLIGGGRLNSDGLLRFSLASEAAGSRLKSKL